MTKHENFDKYEELAQQYANLLRYLDGFSVELQSTAPKFFKQITSDISKNYSQIIKIISYNENYETKFELKTKKLDRFLIKLNFKALKAKDKIDRKLLVMRNKLALLPNKLELTKAKVQYEKQTWVYLGKKIRLWFKTWFGSDKPKLTRAEKKALKKANKENSDCEDKTKQSTKAQSRLNSAESQNQKHSQNKKWISSRVQCPFGTKRTALAF